jgi:O-antigen/teichoic acid export membrane protein
MSADQPPEARDPLTVEEIKGRAASGAVTLGARNALVFGLGLVGNLVLARLLAPSEIGLVALGTTVITFARFLADSGLAPALLGRARVPSRAELGAVVGFQLAATTAIAAVVGALAARSGGDALVPALMLTCLPIATLRLPTALMMERELSYRAIARADVIEAVVGYTWAIGTVAAGWGVWGLASAAPIRVAAGTIAMISFGSVGFVRPRLDWRLVRPLLGFGLRFQAIVAVQAIRDQGLNAGIAVIGGVSTLGIWSLAFRIMQVPFVLFVNLVRISYPAMSRLLEADEDPRRVIEQTIGVVAVVLSPVLVGIAASSDALLPAALGSAWEEVPEVLAWASLAMMVSAPIAIPATGYMLASGAVTRVLLVTALQASTWMAAAFSLLTPLGVRAVGIGWLAGSVVEATLLSAWTSRRSGARMLRTLARPLAVALAAGGFGLALSQIEGNRVLMGIAALGCAELLLLGGLRLLARDDLRAAFRITRRAVAGARAAG